MARKTLYDILEVTPGASMEVITASYRVLMKKECPNGINDKNERIARQINRAKEILTDITKRRDYDLKLEGINGKTKGKIDYSDLTGELIEGRYKVINCIGDGGFGKTYKAENIDVQLPVCIKRGDNLSKFDEEFLLDEARAMWDLRHYGIPSVKEVLRLEDTSMALVMSYIPGKDLRKIVEETGPIDPEHVAWITERQLNILSYLHDNRVIHGDIKPHNIIIQPKIHLVVTVDYGLAEVIPKADSTSRGYTEFFAPPEQMSLNMPLIPESDFYSLGMTMIYALGGDIMKKQVPESTPDHLCDFIKRLIVIDPLSRPNREKEDLMKTISDVRQKCFGRRNSGMKPMPGVD